MIGGEFIAQVVVQLGAAAIFYWIYADERKYNKQLVEDLKAAYSGGMDRIIEYYERQLTRSIEEGRAERAARLRELRKTDLHDTQPPVKTGL